MQLTRKTTLLWIVVGASLLLIAGFAVLPASADPAASPAATVSAQQIAVPAYFYPESSPCKSKCYWAQMDNAAPTVGLAIVNPNSGPGKSVDSTYLAAVQTAQGKGIQALGYVHTSYGKRSAVSAKQEIDAYYSWYHVGGIFLDEVSDSCSKASYYADLYAYIKAKGGTATVIINPGANVPECYAPVADVIVNYEDTYKNYAKWKPSSWVTNYPASKFWHIIYSTKQADLAKAVSLSKQRNAGWLFVSSDGGSNPYDTLPLASYWSAELSAAQLP